MQFCPLQCSFPAATAKLAAATAAQMVPPLYLPRNMDVLTGHTPLRYNECQAIVRRVKDIAKNRVRNSLPCSTSVTLTLPTAASVLAGVAPLRLQSSSLSGSGPLWQLS